MVEAVSCWPFTAEARVRARVTPYGICGGPSGTGTGISPSSSVFPCQYHSIIAPYQGRGVHVTGVSAAYTFKLNKKHSF
jgi:hypothetical protein